MSDYGPAHWDEKYAAQATVWGAAPNIWVEQEVRDLPSGRALDLACGEGRNALWLDSLGWQVRAVDFSPVAVAKGRSRPSGVEWVVADVTTYVSPAPVDLALLCYLQVPAAHRRAAVRHAAEALDPGGRLLVVAHHTRNRTDGTGGPQRDEVLYTPEGVAADLDGTGLHIDKAIEVLRPVEGADRPAIDTLVLATAP
jgi:SAM-dependent methyltransferase